jgi:hypothetical protein
MSARASLSTSRVRSVGAGPKSFVCDHRKTGDDGLRLEGSEYGREYSHLCKVITEDVDEVAGFYVWGRYDRKRYWHSIYLGKAGYKKDKKNLRKRILEELKDERAFVWRYIYDQTEVLADETAVFSCRGSRPPSRLSAKIRGTIANVCIGWVSPSRLPTPAQPYRVASYVDVGWVPY